MSSFLGSKSSKGPFFLFRLGSWILSLSATVSWAWSFSDHNNNNLHSRRSILNQWITAATTTTAVVGTTTFGVPFPVVAAAAADTDDATSEWYYFGAGCFWHMQHEFIQAERTILGRTDPNQYTSLAGYAGGTRTDENGRVCYHNLLGVADYGKLGHGEVVGMKLPSSKNDSVVTEFAKFYFTLFNPKTKDRVDPMDRGAEYRSLMGLPGGINHPAYSEIQSIASAAGFTLRPGVGNDPDTLGKQIVWVHDTAQFPFYPAEVYHQYHDDFQSPPYGRAYNRLADVAFQEGRIQTTGCPDRV